MKRNGMWLSECRERDEPDTKRDGTNPAIFPPMKRLLPLLLLIMVSASPYAEDKGYKITRPDGSVEFSDQPGLGAEEIPLPKAQSYEAPPVPPAKPAAKPAAPKGPPYTQLAIESPLPEQTFRNSETTVTVSIRVDPPLRASHELAILLDGNVVSTGTGLSFTLSSVERGSHVLVAQVRDGRGNVVQGSAPVTFFMHQHSSLFNPPPVAPKP
jgi:hypothetical protein